jgi:hypothetical protein
MTTLKQASESIANRYNFNAGNLSGQWQLMDSLDEPKFVVFSYGVAIGISLDTRLGRKDYVPLHAYNHSVTTSKHANIVKRAWGLPKNDRDTSNDFKGWEVAQPA